MSTPNGLNPTFEGKVTAGGFEAIHGKGVTITAVTLAGTQLNSVNVFGTTVNVYATITGIFANAIGAVAQTITVVNTDGTVATFGTIAGKAGEVFAPAEALVNISLTPSDTFQVYSSDSSDRSIVFITYKVDRATIS
jgi:hypothetical protein